MYKINTSLNQLEPLDEKGFAELGFRERSHLQEWIAKNPECLGEELLIIQKEFDGFFDTSDRLDLLALDKQGNLVIIENKLDDSGCDTTWQAVKYASFCSTLNYKQIEEIYSSFLLKQGVSESPKLLLEEFFQNEDYAEKLNVGNSQRIILVAGNFRKEATSSVLWLMNFGVRIQCFKATPYSFGDDTFLNLEQIIPIQNAEEYTISMAQKNQSELTAQKQLRTSQAVRFEFWSQFIKAANKKTILFNNVSPNEAGWIGAATGVSGVTVNCVVTRSYARVEIYINKGTREENKEVFDYFFAQKESIERAFGGDLVWERKDDKVTSRIKIELTEVSVFENGDWGKMIDFLVLNSEKMSLAFKNSIKALKT